MGGAIVGLPLFRLHELCVAVKRVLQLVDLLMSTKTVDYSSYTFISCCTCVIYYLVFTVLTRWLLSVRALLVGVALAQERRLFCWKYFEEVCTVKVAVKRRLSLKLLVSFVGRSSHTME